MHFFPKSLPQNNFAGRLSDKQPKKHLPKAKATTASSIEENNTTIEKKPFGQSSLSCIEKKEERAATTLSSGL